VSQFPVLKKVNREQQNIRDGANLTLNPMRDSGQHKALEFYFWLPKDWDPNYQYTQDYKWPVIIFLHVCIAFTSSSKSSSSSSSFSFSSLSSSFYLK
jgi:predicted peptidase